MSVSSSSTLSDISRTYWFTGLIAVLVLLPLPFGGNRPWASDLFSVVSALLLLGMAINIYLDPEQWPVGGPVRRLGVGAGLIALTALWAFLQTQSWMPAAWHHPLWRDVQSMPGALAGSISIDPGMFPESLARLLAYVACFLLAFVGGRNNERAHLLLQVLGIAAVVYALYGLLMQSTGLRMVLWYDKWAYEDFVTSTFVNKNSYATYAGLGLQVCLALLWQRMKNKPAGELAQRSLKAAWLEKLSRRDSVYVIMVLIVLGALVLSGSRAGMVSALAGCIVFLTALAVNRRGKLAMWLPFLVLGLALILGLSLVSSSSIHDRLDQSNLQADTPLRLRAYEISLRAIAGNPWLGFGLGGFESAFRLYRDPEFTMWFQHAHNDYLELAIELGLPAALMLLTAILLMVSCCAGGVWRRRRQEIYSALGLSASATVGLHAMADFSMQIPAVAATYAALLGLGVAQSWSNRRHRDRDERFHKA
jgi:O-antigen ligase